MKMDLSPEELIAQITQEFPDEHPLKALEIVFDSKLSEGMSKKEIDDLIDNANKELSMTITNYCLDLTDDIIKNNAKGTAQNAFRLQDLLTAIITMVIDSYYKSSRMFDDDIIALVCKRHNERVIENLEVSKEIYLRAKKEIQDDLDLKLKEYGIKYPNDPESSFEETLKKVHSEYILTAIKITEAFDQKRSLAEKLTPLARMQHMINTSVVTAAYQEGINKDIPVNKLIKKFVADFEHDIKSAFKSMEKIVESNKK